MITTQFEQGNYNQWYESVVTIMPKINDLIRHDLLTTLDNTLISMVGTYSDIAKDTINVTYILEDDSIEGVTCTFSYRIDDFKVPNAPDEAVVTDCTAIKSVFDGKPYTIKSININKTTGVLTMTVDFIYDILKKNDKV